MRSDGIYGCCSIFLTSVKFCKFISMWQPFLGQCANRMLLICLLLSAKFVVKRMNEMYFGTFCKNGFLFRFQFPAWQTSNTVWLELETNLFGWISPWNAIVPHINVALICASHDYIGNAPPKTTLDLAQIIECRSCSYHTLWYDDNMHVRIQLSTLFLFTKTFPRCGVGFCAYGLTRNALCHRGCLSAWVSDWISEWVSECKTVSAAKSLSTVVLAREAGVRYRGRTTTRGFKSNWEVSAAFVTTRANG